MFSELPEIVTELKSVNKNLKAVVELLKKREERELEIIAILKGKKK